MVGVSNPVHTITSVPWVLVVADKVDVWPSTTTTESVDAKGDADPEDLGAPEVWRVYVFPPTTYSPPGPTLTVLVTEAGVVVVVIVVVLADRLEV